jgi:glycosyltransferase involved in cell wall biosynthesis
MPEPDTPYISLVLPAYNEEENLPVAVAQALPHLRSISPAWEVVVVNDASTDRTAEVAKHLAAEHSGRVVPVHHRHNLGLGGAIRTGFAAARGEIIVYCDSDLPFDMSAIEQAHTLMQEAGVDVVVGHRFDRAEDGPLRRLYTRGYNTLVSGLLGLQVRDVNCPLKMLRRAVIDRIQLVSNGSFIDAEMLAQATEAGFTTAELDVVYTPRVRGTSTLARPAVVAGILRDLALYKLGRLNPQRQARPSGPRLSTSAGTEGSPHSPAQ